MLLQGGSQLGLPLQRKDLVGVSIHRILQAESVVVSCYVESIQHASRRNERSIECIHLISKSIHIVVKPSESLQ